MSSTARTPNFVEGLSAQDSITGVQNYLTSTGRKLDVNAVFSATSLAINDGSNSAIKATVIESTSDPGTFGLVALNPDGSNISGGGGGSDVNLIEVGGAAIALGQTTMSASLPVTIASNQSALTVQATNLDIRDLVFATDKVDASGSTVTANAGTNLNTSALLTTSDFNAAFGTAGSADTQVLSVQGIASMTPVQVSQATASNLNATVIGAGSAGTANAGVVTVQGIAGMTKLLVTPDANSAINVAQIAGTATAVNNGGVSNGTQRVTIANDSTGILASIGSITSSMVPGTAAANLGKAEDAQHASGDTGIAVWGVRNDDLSTTFGANGDYTPLATDAGGRTMVAQKAATATLSNVSTSGTSATLLSANSARIGATITNEATTVLFVKFGTTASATSYTVSMAGAASAPYSYYEVPAGYTGRIDGILASSTGTARVTEIT